MPIWRLSAEDNTALRKIIELNWVGDSSEQYDGSFTLQCSRAASNIIGKSGIELEFVSENLIQWPPNPLLPEFINLVPQFGNWAVLKYLQKNPAGTPEDMLAGFRGEANVAS